MEIDVQLVPGPITETISPPPTGRHGAWLEFRGVVRGEENGERISGLEYEAYPEMARREIRRLIEEISSRHPCLAAKVIHRVGIIPVGETAIYVGVAAGHRAEAIALLAGFMDKLKQDVPIWKRRALPAVAAKVNLRSAGLPQSADLHRRLPKVLSLDEAMAEIQSRCLPLRGVSASLEECLGRVLHETVCAPTDAPDGDRSTRDGYAILQNDPSKAFTVVDTLHAVDWKPRKLKAGQAVRVATGASLPGEHLRVVMQENVERIGDKIRITKHEAALNIRKRGEEIKAGQPLLSAGTRLDAGKLALLASAGCARPLVSPRPRVVHFTTGDELVPPEQALKPGQVRDSNSILIRSLLQKFICNLEQAHLPENFEQAKSVIGNRQSAIENSDLLLISGGASVGDKDFTRPLLEWLGFEIVFSQVNVRPGRPLIFGQSGARIAFGLPGNPLSHFVCFHLFTATALAKLAGSEPPTFQRGALAAKFEEAPNPRETLWPARLDSAGLHPLAWASSGDLTCVAGTNALIRVLANRGPMDAGAEVDFWPTATLQEGS
jgi:molybdopterin molybdotransferase